MFKKGSILAASLRKGGFEVCEALEDANFLKKRIKVKVYKSTGMDNTFFKLSSNIQDIEVDDVLEEIETCDLNRFQMKIPDSQLAKITLAIDNKYSKVVKDDCYSKPSKCGSTNFSVSSTVLENVVFGSNTDVFEFSSITSKNSISDQINSIVRGTTSEGLNRIHELTKQTTTNTISTTNDVIYENFLVDKATTSDNVGDEITLPLEISSSSTTDCPNLNSPSFNEKPKTTPDIFEQPHKNLEVVHIIEVPSINTNCIDTNSIPSSYNSSEDTFKLPTFYEYEEEPMNIEPTCLPDKSSNISSDQQSVLVTTSLPTLYDYEEESMNMESTFLPDNNSSLSSDQESVLVTTRSKETSMETEKTSSLPVSIITRGHQQDQSLETERTNSSTVLDENVGNCGSSELYFAITKKQGPMKNKRVYDKRHVCFYCHQRKAKITRHLISNHSNEQNVAKCLAMPLESPDRKSGFLSLLRMGDFFHNCEVLEKKEGELILVRRPSDLEAELLSPTDYGPCPDCAGFMVRKHLWHHAKTCFLSRIRKSNEDEAETKRNIMQQSRALVYSAISPMAEKSFKENILEKLLNDERGEVAKNDQLIIQFGIIQFEKHCHQQFELIRQSMRQCARLLIELKTITNRSNFTLADFIHPNHFDSIVAAVQNLCSRNVSAGNSGIPSLALKIGFHMQKCAGILRGRYLRAGLADSDDSTKRFMELYNLEWQDKVSARALNDLRDNKMNVSNPLPLTNDLMDLNKYIKSQLEVLKIKLTNNKSDKETWLELSKIVLCRIILFNKKRSGEASKMKTNDFKEVDWLKESSDELQQSLSDLERHLADTLSLIQIKGKRGRIVPVLITPDIKSIMSLLLETRSSVGVDAKNDHFFARPYFGSLSHIRGSDCLREITGKVQLKQPELVTSTKLRKYVATVSQVFNLDERQVDWLARHLGHDLTVHRNFYRLHESALELTKVSKILLAVDKGMVHTLQGKNIDDLNLEDLLDDTDQQPPADERNIDENAAERDVSAEESDDNDMSNDDPEYLPDLERPGPSNRITPEPTPRMAWNSPMKKRALNHFRDNISMLKVPGKAGCEEFIIGNSDVIGSVHWKKIKQFVDAHIRKRKKLLNNKRKSK